MADYPELVLTGAIDRPGQWATAWMRQQGGYRRLRRGVWVREAEWAALTPIQQHVVEARAVFVASPRDWAWFAGVTAAALWGLPLICAWPVPVRQEAVGPMGGRSRAGVTRHWAQEPPPAAMRSGLPVTGLARTVLDLGRFESVEAGVVAGDAAIAKLGLARGDLVSALAALDGRRGVGRARVVATEVDGRSGSVGETLSRLRFPLIGVPAPVLQQRFDDDDGLIGYVDFWWPDYGVVGEFDGRVKYESPEIRRGRTDTELLWDEKRREDRLRALGVTVVRWTWAELFDLPRLSRLLGRAGLPSAGSRVAA